MLRLPASATALQLERAGSRARAAGAGGGRDRFARGAFGGDLEEIFLATTGRSLRDEVEQ
ncbi:MAG: hypothetical protein R3E96_09625 [Planctomycetota bacterium]